MSITDSLSLIWPFVFSKRKVEREEDEGPRKKKKKGGFQLQAATEKPIKKIQSIKDGK